MKIRTFVILALVLALGVIFAFHVATFVVVFSVLSVGILALAFVGLKR